MKPSALLGADGPFARKVPGFVPRDQQGEMADLIAEVLESGEKLVCEAGTGTGKTFAYLVPLLESGLKTIVSTATKTLQDQLFHRDLPVVLEALASFADVALLKGRANYVCRYRLARAAGDPQLDTRAAAQLAAIDAWVARSESGDIGEAPGIPEDSPVWPFATSTPENCLGQACNDYERCFVVRARRQAVAADLVVVNHHLLFADLALREEGFGELLPTAQAIVLDESHQLPDIASNFFGHALSSRQLRDLARDTRTAQEREAPDMPALREAVMNLEVAARALAASLGPAVGRYDEAQLRRAPAVVPALTGLGSALAALNEQLELAAERGAELESCAKRAVDVAVRLAIYRGDDESWVRWGEVTSRGYVLHVTPLSIAEHFQARTAHYAAAWIFTSATLSVGGSFAHFERQLGLAGVREALWESPFDYARQALLYLPKLGCEPNSPNYADAVSGLVERVTALSGGRTFVLFTSYRALESCAERLASSLEFPVLVQGAAPRATLLREFTHLGNAVLLGTSTFWEGVDVRGEALSCVIIDKLPFAPPDDPITSARVKALQQEGGNAFNEYQVPQAVITLKQGAGRLIRDVTDRGVLVLCDPRLTTRGYGKVFLRSLPAMPVTSDLAAVAAFFDAALTAS
ncbi:MAG: ATP-dependent DNA helicase [Gammaproteobacteria bacterium]|nr:ATP-dependent DNA helicase [Gammaproteobacteria bacterium]